MNNGQIVSQGAQATQGNSVSTRQAAIDQQVEAFGAAMEQAMAHPELLAGANGGTPIAPQKALDQVYGARFVALCLDQEAFERVKAQGVACGLANALDPLDPWSWIAHPDARLARRSGAQLLERLPSATDIARLDPDVEPVRPILDWARGRSVLVIGRADPALGAQARIQAHAAAATLAQALIIHTDATDVRVDVVDAFGDAEHAMEQGDSIETMAEDLPFELSEAAARQPGAASRRLNGPAALEAMRVQPGFEQRHLLGGMAGELRQMTGAAKRRPCEAGYRKVARYAEAKLDTALDERKILHIRLPYPRKRDGFNPAWECQVVRKKRISRPKADGGGFDEVSVVEWEQVASPYLWLDHTLQVVAPHQGVLQLNNPDFPTTVRGIYKGRSDDMRDVVLSLKADVDHNELTNFGFNCDQKMAVSWKQFNKALRGEAAARSKLGTGARGWLIAPHPGATPEEIRDTLPTYIHSSRVYSPANGREVVSLDANDAAMGLSVAGSFAKWKEAMELAFLNPAVATLAGTAASSALLSRVRSFEPVIIHINNQSGAGKGVIVKLIASMIGSPAAPGDVNKNPYIKAWDTTGNGLAAPLAARNHSFYILDELGQLKDASHLLGLLYAIANGVDKQRMTKEGGMRKVLAWMTNLFSTGEIGFASKIAEAARGSKANGHGELPTGLMFRIIELTMDANNSLWAFAEGEAQKENYGVYGELVERHPSISPHAGGKVVDALVGAVDENHGHFWEQWIRFLQTKEGFAQAEGWVDEITREISALTLPGDARVAQRRAKHVVAALTGLKGVLAICQFSPEREAQIWEGAKEWATKVFWHAGLENRTETESQRIAGAAHAWMLSNEKLFWAKGDAWEPQDAIGWRDPATGAAVLTSNGQARLIAAIHTDPSRFKIAMSEAGWQKLRTRHPRQGYQSGPLHVLAKDGFFYTGQTPPAAANGDEGQALAA